VTAEQRSKGPDEKFCESCGEIIKLQAEICPKCGVRQKKSPTSGKSKTTAGILALLIGGLGVHKFYLGQAGMGILYLLFCWTGIPLLVGLIEGIVYLTMDEEKFAEKYSS
jgi:TM2 domain-containing membrane protein YozV